MGDDAARSLKVSKGSTGIEVEVEGPEDDSWDDLEEVVDRQLEKYDG